MAEQGAGAVMSEVEVRRRVLASAAITGAIVGGLWAWQHGESLWEHAIRFGILLFVVAPIVSWRLRRAGGAGPMSRVRMGRLVLAKGVLLVAALVATAALRPVTDGADYVVAVGLFLLITLAGPRLLPWLTSHG